MRKQIVAAVVVGCLRSAWPVLPGGRRIVQNVRQLSREGQELPAGLYESGWKAARAD
jgi:hypothetical protein